MCNCTSYKVTVECNDTKTSGAVYNIELIGPWASSIIHTWLENEQNNYDLAFKSSSTISPTQLPADVKPSQNNGEASSESLVPIVVPTAIVIIVVGSAAIAALAIIGVTRCRYIVCNAY